jgi:hypothetical protein
MKKIFSFLFFLIYSFSFSQTEKLFYYIEKDSLLGVKNQSGKIIVPADITWSTAGYNDTTEIKSKIFLLQRFNYFDRSGKFLFRVYITSEGLDGFREGYIRYEEGKKSGIADSQGNKITLAKYDYISSINFGFAEYCNGCYRDTSEDEEHAPLVGGVWGYVDRNGKEIKTTSKRNHPKDIETKEHTFVPYQFKYNKKEQEILAFFEKRKNQIIKINRLNCSDKKLFFEIVEKPSVFNPFYKIKTFELCDQFPSGADESDDFKNFKVSADGKEFYVLYNDLVDHEKYSEYVERKILIDSWIKSNSKVKQ